MTKPETSYKDVRIAVKLILDQYLASLDERDDLIQALEKIRKKCFLYRIRNTKFKNQASYNELGKVKDIAIEALRKVGME